MNKETRERWLVRWERFVIPAAAIAASIATGTTEPADRYAGLKARIVFFALAVVTGLVIVACLALGGGHG